jgi:hypothetical protein
MPLWQFVSLSIGTAIAGDVNLKLMYALVGQRNSGKGMLMTSVGAAFGDLVDAAKSANNLLGNSSDNDKAKKMMWMTKAAIDGTRLVWSNEIRTLSPKGETYIDGNLVKNIASGGDELEVRGQCENPFSVGHEFTMFLKCSDLPPVKPVIGDSFLHVKFPNRYTEDPVLQNEKKSDPDLKDALQLPAFADGMLWFILEEYMGYLQSGQKFRPIPEVKSETEDANEAEGEDLIVALSKNFDFAPPFSSMDECIKSDFIVKPQVIKDVLGDLKKQGSLMGVSKSGLIMQLGLRGYPKSDNKVQFDAGTGKQYTSWIVGIRRKEGPDPDQECD